MGMWKSRYGNAYISLPSIVENSKLKYELIKSKFDNS